MFSRCQAEFKSVDEAKKMVEINDKKILEEMTRMKKLTLELEIGEK